MAKLKFTKAQHRAVFYPDGNLLLSAAAGSGKTAALTSRIAELVTSGRAEISQMLIVTFTKAAAAEMKTRISKMLREKISEHSTGDRETVSRLSRAVSQLPSADISTIHSFLYKSLKPYFPVLGLPQDASIIEKSEMDAIKAEIMRDTVDDFFERKNGSGDDFIRLADTIGQARDTSAIDRELLWLAQKLNESGQPVSVLGTFARELTEASETGADPMESAYGKRIAGEITSFYQHYRKVFDTFREEFTYDYAGEKYTPALDIIDEWLVRLGEILSEEPAYNALTLHFSSYDQGKLGTIRKDKATEISELFKKYRASFKSDIENIAADFFSASAEEFSRCARKTAKILESALTVIEAYETKLDKKKKNSSILEYSDLEICATRLFLDETGNPTSAAAEVGAKYRYVFIDEYQDTNRVQDNIFRAVSGNAIRFMVGDIKQSIYRFRGADPRVFSEYRRIWDKAPLEGDDIDPNGASIFMSENFRCSEDIIRFINAVSDAILPWGGIPYEKDDALICGGPNASSPVPAEVILIDRKAVSEDETDDDAAPDEDCEAAYTAGRIAEMIGRYTEDGSGIIRPSDIAILLRSPGSDSEDYRKALEKAGVPVKTKTAKPLGEYPSVMLLLCLLRFIDNPLRDIFTAGVMKSSLFGFTVEDIIELRRTAGNLPLYTAVIDRCACADFDAADELSEKCLRLKRFLDEEKTRLGGVSAAKYLENLLASTDFIRLGEIRGKAAETDAVMKVASLARNFDKGRSNRSLGAFIDYLSDFLTEDAESASPAEADAVSIMSIHASKGLEFPVVFLCECAKKRNDRDEKRTVLFDDELGFGMQLPDETGLVKCDNLIRRAIGAKIAEESKEEEMRMLYVALTRAKSKLIVTAKVNYAESWLEEKKAEQSFCDGQSSWSVKQASSYIDWIGTAAAAGESRSWKIITMSASDVRRRNARSADVSADSAETDTELLETLSRRTDFEYPFDFLGSIPAKLIVSRLEPEILDEDSASELITSLSPAPAADEEESAPKEPKRPSFMSEGDTVRANEIGSATHRFLQFADFSAMRDGWKKELGRLIDEKYLSPRDGEIVNKHQLEKFVSSKLFADLIRSDFVKREFRFNVLVDASDFTANEELKKKLAENSVKITVQGVVDCVYRCPDSGKLILIDYKTDSIRPDEWKDIRKAEERLADRHRNQLAYYRKICSELFGEEIACAYIYSTVLGRNIQI